MADFPTTLYFKDRNEVRLPRISIGASSAIPETKDGKLVSSGGAMIHVDGPSWSLCLATCDKYGAAYRLGFGNDRLRWNVRNTFSYFIPNDVNSKWYFGGATGFDFLKVFELSGKFEIEVDPHPGKTFLAGPELIFNFFKAADNWTQYIPAGSRIGALFMWGDNTPTQILFTYSALIGS